MEGGDCSVDLDDNVECVKDADGGFVGCSMEDCKGICVNCCVWMSVGCNGEDNGDEEEEEEEEDEEDEEDEEEEEDEEDEDEDL